MQARGNVLVGEAGGPTAVVDSSLYGLLNEAKSHDEVEEIFGTLHGIDGIFKGKIIDLRKEDDQTLRALCWTPGASLGGCRTQLNSDDPNDWHVKRILEFLKENRIRFFFYIGGNDSMDTAHKIERAAKKVGYELTVLGIPKTVDNDLALTHHSPGYGSAAKYLAASVREAGLHSEAMQGAEPITILVTVGRNSGWLAGSCALARVKESDAPHLVYFPEIPLFQEKLLTDVESVYRRLGRVFIATGEGLKDERGNYITANRDGIVTDGFGHPELGGIAEWMKRLIERELKLRTRVIRPDICQQSAAHFASLTDREEAILVGHMAVRYAVEGRSGSMVTIKASSGEKYRSTTGLAPLFAVANVERRVQKEWINTEGNFPTANLVNYVRPLIRGEVKVPFKDGLPRFARLRKVPAGYGG
jgi:6-phosphofructokinase 1